VKENEAADVHAIAYALLLDQAPSLDQQRARWLAWYDAASSENNAPKLLALRRVAEAFGIPPALVSSTEDGGGSTSLIKRMFS
jgi:hypothetical protein